MHVFDQTTKIVKEDGQDVDSPIRYQKDGTGTDMSKNHCVNDMESTRGELLISGSNMINQTSCGPNTNNSGNWYSWSASTAGGQSSGLESNSICPRGWQLTTNTVDDAKSYYNLLVTTYNNIPYNISTTGFNDSTIRYLPLSFIRTGLYNLGSLNGRGSRGDYWSVVSSSSAGAYGLDFNSGNLYPQNGCRKYYGFAVRCVSR